MGVSLKAHVAPVVEHLDMQWCLFLVVAQPWQGAGLFCTTSALALPYKLFFNPSLEMLWQCAEDLQACRLQCWLRQKQAMLAGRAPGVAASNCKKIPPCLVHGWMLTSACSLLSLTDWPSAPPSGQPC